MMVHLGKGRNVTLDDLIDQHILIGLDEWSDKNI